MHYQSLAVLQPAGMESGSARILSHWNDGTDTFTCFQLISTFIISFIIPHFLSCVFVFCVLVSPCFWTSLSFLLLSYARGTWSGHTPMGERASGGAEEILSLYYIFFLFPFLCLCLSLSFSVSVFLLSFSVRFSVSLPPSLPPPSPLFPPCCCDSSLVPAARCSLWVCQSAVMPAETELTPQIGLRPGSPPTSHDQAVPL